MKKKLLALLVVAVMLVIAACANEPTADPTPADTNGATDDAGGDDAGGDDAGGDDAGGDDAGGDDAGGDDGVAAGGGQLGPHNPVTIDTLIVTSQMAPSPTNKISALLEERLGVTINYEIVPGDQLDTRIGTLLASGDFPDLIAQGDLEFRLIEGGALLRLDDYIFSGDFPALERHVVPFRQAMTYTGDMAEHGIYIFPAFNRWYGEVTGGEHFGPGFFIQKEVLSWAGYPDLSNWTLEAYFDLIEAFMEANPYDENGVPHRGFTFPVDGRTWGMTNPPLHLAGQPNYGGVMVDENYQAHLYAISSYAERYFRKINEINARGLLDPETFIRPNDQWETALAQGNILAMHDQRWAFGNAVAALVQEGRVNRTWVPTEPTFDGATPWYRDRPALNSNQGFGISTTAENPQLLLELLDTLLTQEWQIILSWGIEGEDFMVDADGRFYRTQEQRDNWNDLGWRTENRLMAFFDQLPKIQGIFPDEGFGYGNAWAPGDQPEEFFASLLEWDQQFLQNYGKNTWLDFTTPPPPNPVFYPTWNIPLGDGTPAQLSERMVRDLEEEWLPRIILADPADFDDMWAQFVAAVEAVDIQPYIDAINAGIQHRLELWGEDSRDIVNNR